MTTLYLIRHAEAEGNLYRRIHGQYDSLITDNGYRQIQALEQRFADTPIDAVYSSDLFRTMTTARAIYVPKGLPLQTRADLREMGMGEWEDRTWAGIDRTDHQQMALFSAGSPDFHPPGGETFPEIRRRGTAAILDIAAKHPNQTVAVFSHGTLIRNTLAAFLGYGYGSEEMRKLGHSDNTAVTCLEVEGDTAHTAVTLLEIENGKVRIVYMNDNSHLSPAISTLAQQHWWKKNDQKADVNLWFAPFDLTQEADRAFYQTCREEAWQTLYGRLDRRRRFPGGGLSELAGRPQEPDPGHGRPEPGRAPPAGPPAGGPGEEGVHLLPLSHPPAAAQRGGGAAHRQGREPLPSPGPGGPPAVLLRSQPARSVLL